MPTRFGLGVDQREEVLWGEFVDIMLLAHDCAHIDFAFGFLRAVESTCIPCRLWGRHLIV